MIKKIKFNNTERILTLLTSLVIVFGFYFTWYSAKSRRLQRVQSSVDQTLLNISAKKITLEKIKEKKEEKINVDLTPYKKQIDYLVNTKTSFSDYIQSIGYQSLNEDIIINKVSTEKSTKDKFFKKVYFNIQIESSFLNIGKFIEKLDSSRHLTRIESIDIQRMSSDLQICNVEIKVIAYDLLKDGGNNVAAK